MFGVPYSPIVPSLTRWQSGRQLANREQQVERADDVVDLGEDGVLPIDHRVGRGALLGEVHDRVGPLALDDRGQELVVGDVAGIGLDVAAAQPLPRPQPLGQGANRRQRLNAELEVPLPPDEAVDDRDRDAPAGTDRGRSPSRSSHRLRGR